MGSEKTLGGQENNIGGVGRELSRVEPSIMTQPCNDRCFCCRRRLPSCKPREMPWRKDPGGTLRLETVQGLESQFSFRPESGYKSHESVLLSLHGVCMVLFLCVCVNIAVSPVIVKLASVYRQHTRVGHRNLLRHPSIISTPTSFVESACSLAPHQRHHPRLVSTQLWYSIVVIHDHAYDDCDSSYYDYCSRAVVAAVSTQLWYSQYS